MIRNRVQEAQKQLDRLVALDPLCLCQSKHRKARNEVHQWLECEEKMWQQRSKITWLKGGDRNTCYFHNKASVRRKKNQIGRIHDNTGVCRETKQCDAVIVDYFTQLFSIGARETNLSFLNHLPKSVDESMLRILDAEFTQEEV